MCPIPHYAQKQLIKTLIIIFSITLKTMIFNLISALYQSLHGHYIIGNNYLPNFK